jgi:nitrogen-specific signal transduction histidine kinase
LFQLFEIKNRTIDVSEFDFPLGGKGAIFPLSRGLLQTVGIDDSIVEGNIIVSDGKSNFPEAIREFENDLSHTHHLELLCCEGCVMGAGMSIAGNALNKRKSIKNYVNNKLSNLDYARWNQEIEKYISLDLSQEFTGNDKRILSTSEEEIDAILKKMGKLKREDHLDCGTCGYDTCTEHAIAIANGLAEDEMCLPYTIDKLHNYIKELAVSNEKLSNMQKALTQSEKLAHMGQLSAGIAHELNNPLGVIIMYSNILLEDCQKNSQMREDLELVVEQAARCKTIVSGLLNFARNNQLKKALINISDLINASLNSLIIQDNIMIEKSIDPKLDIIECDKEQMIQVISNLAKNAIEVMPNGGTLSIHAFYRDFNSVALEISDTGSGISKANMDKIFTPFFTTKPNGKGTGLGLSTTYGIIKMHKGKITVDSNNDTSKGKTGTKFKIILPLK